MTMHNDLYSDESIRGIADAAVHLADLALAFGRIERTGPCHPDGTPESDADHTVMLCWFAPSLAHLINERMGFAHYDVDRIAAFAAVHDAAEVYAGDTCTVKISEEELAQKADREAIATTRLYKEFRGTLPWFATMVDAYESQASKEAAFVRAVDKVLPKMVHLVDKRVGLYKLGITRADLLSLFTRQRVQVRDNIRAGRRLVLAIYDALCEQVLAQWDDEASRVAVPQPERHWINVSEWGMKLHHHNCAHEGTEVTCPFTVAWHMCQEGYAEWPDIIMQVGAQGDYSVVLNERGLLMYKED